MKRIHVKVCISETVISRLSHHVGHNDARVTTPLIAITWTLLVLDESLRLIRGDGIGMVQSCLLVNMIPASASNIGINCVAKLKQAGLGTTSSRDNTRGERGVRGDCVDVVA